MLEWLLAPIDGTRAHDVGLLVSWHGRLMVVAWAVLFPTGILAARYFKIMPGQDWPNHLDNLIWWRAHLILQYCGGVLVLAALVLILQLPDIVGWHTHRILGWLSIVLCGVQFLLGWFRGSKGGPTERKADGSIAGDHYDMTKRRNTFEYCHKSIGYLAVVLASAAIVTGLWHTNAPRWMLLSLAVWWTLTTICFVTLQRRGFAIDTYQAIWGPDPIHPGNRVKPIGWGITRRNPE